MFEKKYHNFLDFKNTFFHKIHRMILNGSHQALLFHYAFDLILLAVVVSSVFQIVQATTPNPGHPWSEIGDGTFAITGIGTTARTFTIQDANATILSTTSTVSDKQIIVTSPTSNNVTGITIPAGYSIRRNAGDTAFESYVGGDMLLSGIQTVTGAKTFGSTGAVGKLIIAGSTSGSTILDATPVAGAGTVTLPTTGTLATLAGNEALTTKTYNGLTVTNNGTNTLNIAAGQTLTVTTGGTLGSAAYTASTSYAPAFTSGSANYFWATPNGTTGVPSLRAIVAADIPTLNQNTTGTAANISGGSGGQVLYQSGAGTTAKLTNGTTGQILTSGGTTVAPSWTTPPISIVNSSNLFSTGLTGAGSGVTSTTNSNFFGPYAGYGATSASLSNFLGYYSGYGASSAAVSNFIGQHSGDSATNATESNFIGDASGKNATNASYSNFIGINSGYGASNASYSNLIGYNAGYNPGSNNIGSNNIIIGTNISLPGATANAMNLGGILFGTGLHSDITTDPSITASSGGRIGIGIVNPSSKFEVLGKSVFLGTTIPPTLRAPTISTPTGTAITSCTELQDMNLDLTASYYLANDIDCSATSTWNGGDGFTPVGNQGNGGFTGILDGQGHKITKLYISLIDTNGSGVGLFGLTAVGSQIFNVGLEDVNISNVASSSWTNYTGALAGGNYGTITGSYSTGVVHGDSYTGGLVGANDGLDSIYTSYSTADVTGNSNVGGLAGWNQGVIENSYATGSVTGTGSNIGGFVGGDNGTSITNSYSTGAVSGSTAVGGFDGYKWSTTVTSSYWDTETSGQSSSAGGTGMTSLDMSAQSTFSGWDFGSIWKSPLNTTSSKVVLDKGLISSTGTGDNYFAGNVGLGILVPQAKLDVSGKAHFSNDALTPTLKAQTLPSTSGTAITSCSELQDMNNDVTLSYYLANDIDCSETTTWNSGAGFMPIGYTYDNSTSTPYGSNFTGTFNGNGHTISNLYINLPTYYDVGLFGETSGATIENVGLMNVNIIGLGDVGGLIGYDNSSSSVTNSYTTGNIKGSDWEIGGLIGWNNGGSIYGSYSEANVDGGTSGDIGGLVGGISGSTGSTENSYATGSVSGGNGVGGFTGYVSSNIIINSYSTGAVTGTTNVGGFSGFDDGGATVTNSYWDMETSGQSTDNYASGKTTSQMKSVATYSGWDFSTVWEMISSSSGSIILNKGLITSTGSGYNSFSGILTGGGSSGIKIDLSGNVGIGTKTPTAKLDVRVPTPSSISYTPIQSGTGLNDISMSGTYTGATPNMLLITIDSTGTTDTFSYQDFNGDCPLTSSVSITGSPQLVCDGLSVKFKAVTGHTNGDGFLFSLGAGNTALSIGDGVDKYFTVNAVAPDSNFIGNMSGLMATGAYSSNFLGPNAGIGATNAHDSNFLGPNAGIGATNAHDS
ncbi:MAG: GLUG motif-containing protein, partial [Candidatus Nomurabacteria bacterium]